jgi:hypothetical protein
LDEKVEVEGIVRPGDPRKKSCQPRVVILRVGGLTFWSTTLSIPRERFTVSI